MTHLLEVTTLQQPICVAISGSKSETNRLLLLQALYSNLSVINPSTADDALVMQKALATKANTVNIHHAGTAMRFLTAYFAIQEDREVVLTGSPRMTERPIGILVAALRQLGADIEYLENEGFPPIRIKGKRLTKYEVSLSASVSSQYISALLLIAPQLANGLELTLEGHVTSLPYIKMTLALLHKMGIASTFENNVIKVNHQSAINNINYTIESDWSSASYWYSIIALSKIGTKVTLSSYKENSLQGDALVTKLYEDFGVTTRFKNDTITLQKTENSQQSTINYSLNHTPDLAQTIAVTCFGLGLKCNLTGLHTLKIKETDRLVALQNELQKLGGKVTITQDRISITDYAALPTAPITICTYNDHRMAMAFAPLAVRFPIAIENIAVVSKSYPQFWKDVEQFGFSIRPK
jgi:3-phosphoshikimate 1-carboxyvinyltransferase